MEKLQEIKNIDKIKIDYEKLKNNAGLDFCGLDAYNIYYYIASIIYYLYTHNKNYTKEQERKIETLQNIFDCIEY